MFFVVKELMGIPGMPTTTKGIRQALDKLADGTDLKRKREGTNAFEFHIDCLSPVARASILKKQDVIKVAGIEIKNQKKKAGNYSRELLWQSWDKASEKKREKARQRCEVALSVAQIIDSGISAMTAFESVAKAYAVSPASTQRWYYQVKPFDRSDWLSVLVSKDGTNLEVNRNKVAECSPEAWELFCGDYLRLEQPALRTCYARLEEAAEAHNWSIPSLSGIRRKVEREIPYEQLVLLREGEHALMALYPAQERSILELDAMEWINGDGYQHNVFVRWFNGEVIRPKTWIWQDIRTRKILGWRTDVSENSDSIRLSLADVIEKYGIPSITLP